MAEEAEVKACVSGDLGSEVILIGEDVTLL